MYLQKSTFSKSSCDLRIASAELLLFILNTTKTPRDLLRNILKYFRNATIKIIISTIKTTNKPLPGTILKEQSNKNSRQYISKYFENIYLFSFEIFRNISEMQQSKSSLVQ